jgi:leucine dehydrogenase
MDPLEMLAGAGHEQLWLRRDAAGQACVVAAIHSTRLGPAFGGIRRRAYPGLIDALRDVLALAEAMTWKCAMAEVPAGGGKMVILDHADLDREAAVAGEMVAGLAGRFYTGPDVGTVDADLRVVARHTTNVATAAVHGDIGMSTARGVFAGIRATLQRIGVDHVRRARVVVQGAGAVGLRLCELLCEAGSEVVAGDVDAAAAARAAAAGARIVPADELLRTECTLLAPCALGGVIDETVAQALPARAVCGAANNLLATPAAGAVLHARGIPCAPDFVANSGGLIHGVTVQLHGDPPKLQRYERVGKLVGELLAESARTGVPPAELALAEARRRVGFA